MQTSLRRKHRDRVVRRGLGLVIESDVRRRPRLRSHLRLPRSHLSVCACRAAVLRDRRGPRALCQPADEHPVSRARARARSVATATPLDAHRARAPCCAATACRRRVRGRPPAVLHEAHAPLFRAQTCNFDVLYACAAARPNAHLHRHSARVAAHPRRYLTCGSASAAPCALAPARTRARTAHTRTPGSGAPVGVDF